MLQFNLKLVNFGWDQCIWCSIILYFAGTGLVCRCLCHFNAVFMSGEIYNLSISVSKFQFHVESQSFCISAIFSQLICLLSYMLPLPTSYHVLLNLQFSRFLRIHNNIDSVKTLNKKNIDGAIVVTALPFWQWHGTDFESSWLLD